VAADQTTRWVQTATASNKSRRRRKKIVSKKSETGLPTQIFDEIFVCNPRFFDDILLIVAEHPCSKRSPRLLAPLPPARQRLTRRQSQSAFLKIATASQKRDGVEKT
jgi:hypothetical protein